jgi:hypothetical protein
MKKERRIILRTETFERITLRQTSKTIKHQAFTLEVYKIEISKADAEGKQIIFEAKIHGFIEIEETDEEIWIVYRKK